MTDRNLMSIMELAHDILTKNKKAMTFADIFDAICEIKNIGEEEKANIISQVYADFISSAKFVYVGDEEWDVKGRRSIELWDKDGAYYDEYPDFEEELSRFEDSDEDFDLDEEDEEDEEESTYEHDFDIDDEDEEDIDEEDEEEIDEEFLEEFKEEFSDEDNMYDDFENEEEEDYIEDEEDLVFPEDEESEDFDDEEYNEYMDDYEKMYDD